MIMTPWGGIDLAVIVAADMAVLVVLTTLISSLPVVLLITYLSYLIDTGEQLNDAFAAIVNRSSHCTATVAVPIVLLILPHI